MATVEAISDLDKWRGLIGMFVRGHRRRFGDKTVPGRVIWRRDSHIRGGERFDDGRDVPRSVVAARFTGRCNPRTDIFESDGITTEALCADQQDEVDRDILKRINADCKPVSLGEYLGVIEQQISTAYGSRTRDFRDESPMS